MTDQNIHNEDGNGLMDEKEAKSAINSFIRNTSKAGVQILNLFERRGWKALGYRSWEAFLRNEFQNYDVTYLNRLRDAAKTCRTLKIKHGEWPESVTRPMNGYKDEEKILIWRTVNDRYKKITAKVVEDTIEILMSSNEISRLEKKQPKKAKKLKSIFQEIHAKVEKLDKDEKKKFVGQLLKNVYPGVSGTKLLIKKLKARLETLENQNRDEGANRHDD